jgi:hypothetical protein
VWCQDKNLSLNVIQKKEMIVDYREERGQSTPPFSLTGLQLRRLRASSFLVSK